MRKADSRILFVDNHNFLDFPVGGTLTVARNMMRVFGDRLALVGVSDELERVGRWTELECDGTNFDFFAYRRVSRVEEKGLLPHKVQDFVALRRQMGRIRSRGWRTVFVQIQNGMMALAPYRWNSVCCCLPGVSNIAAFSKYRWIRPFAGMYDRALFKSIQNADIVLAAADRAAIDELVARSRGRLPADRVKFFPTRIDTAPFEAVDRATARASLGIDPHTRVVLYCGRVSWPKGWDLVLAGFAEATRTSPDAKLLVVGDGEDAPALRRRAEELGVASRVRLEGTRPRSTLPLYFAAADAVAIGSFVEGWSNTMLEALASGRAVVSTAVSGAREMITHGVNGFVVEGRDPLEFGRCLSAAWDLRGVAQASRELVRPFRLDTLRPDLERLWPAIREA